MVLWFVPFSAAICSIWRACGFMSILMGDLVNLEIVKQKCFERKVVSPIVIISEVGNRVISWATALEAFRGILVTAR